MYNVKKITNDYYWVGACDRKLPLFENIYPTPGGMAYNSYILLDEKTVLFDTVDKAVAKTFCENVEHVLNSRQLDYMVISHMEPDHCALVEEIILRWPDVKFICSAKAVVMMKQFFDFDITPNAVIVADGDVFSAGAHELQFFAAPMVHWPEVIVTYDKTDKILFSADAFGSFGALEGGIFADETDFDIDEARRYYANIVGKYAAPVSSLLKKVSGLDIALLCPLHGSVWRKNIGEFVEKYRKWSSYTPEEDAVVIAYGSIYGNTENAVNKVAGELSEKGVRSVKIYDVSKTDPSYILSEAFRASHIILASVTYNGGLFTGMETLISEIEAHGLQNRKIALIENGSWAPATAGIMRKRLSAMKNIEILEQIITLRGALKPEQQPTVDAFINGIIESLPNTAFRKTETIAETGKIDNKAIYKLTYGLFVLSSKYEGGDNGCIINTVTQITSTPMRITIAVNKANFTHDMIMKSGIFNVSVLSVNTPFDIFTRFGFQSGRNTDKLNGFEDYDRTENGVIYLSKYANAVISAKVTATEDYGTHTLFTADITGAEELSGDKSTTYEYYLTNIKPKPETKVKRGFICKICGYIYEGDTLPEDFICPVCKHPASDFERIK